MDEFKILLLGSDAVGKTTCFQSVTGELIDVSYRPTLVINVGFKVLNLNDRQIGLRIWDLGGQTFLRPAWREYYSKTDGCILIYDITRRYTFEDILDWKKDLAKYLNKEIPFILVGNKMDLESERKVTSQEGKTLQTKIKAVAFFEISVLMKINVKEVFEKLASSLIKK